MQTIITNNTDIKSSYQRKVLEIESIISEGLENNKIFHNNLASGDLGIILFYIHLAQVQDDDTYLQKAFHLLEKVFDNYRFRPGLYSFCSGAAGLVWLLGYLAKEDYISEDMYDSIAEMESALIARTMQLLNKKDYDYFHQALGIFVSLLPHNLRTVNKDQFIQNVVLKLQEIGEHENDQHYRWLDVDYITHEVKPNTYNFGMAHGIPSIISILCKAHAHTANEALKNDILKLAGSAGLFLLSYESTGETFSLYPYSVDTTTPVNYQSRLAYCYGDLSVAMAYRHLFNASKDAHWKKRYNRVVQHSCSRRDLIQNTIIDAGFCHGTGGLSQIYRSFYYSDGDMDYLQAADYWIEKTYQFATYPDGLAGYKYYSGKEDGYKISYGLLDGIAGIGLSYLSAIHNKRLTWDEVWLVS